MVTNHCPGQASEDATISIGTVPHTGRVCLTVSVRRTSVTALMIRDGTARVVAQALSAMCQAEDVT